MFDADYSVGCFVPQFLVLVVALGNVISHAMNPAFATSVHTEFIVHQCPSP